MNGVSTIRVTSYVPQWRYINTKDNPAYDASRGMKVENLLASGRRIEGPKFLSEPEEDWPVYTTDVTILCDDLEVKKGFTVNTIIKDSSNATDQLIAYFSDWRNLTSQLLGSLG